MKLFVLLKDPDGFNEAISEHVEEGLKALGLPKAESEALFDVRFEKARVAISKWVEYGEYIGIEFDTDAGTARVLTVKECGEQ